MRAITLSGPITCAFLPQSPHSYRLAAIAHGLGKEVMLHLPMQALDSRKLGEGGLWFNMSRPQFVRTIRAGLEAVPHVSGVNNHMGSFLTQFDDPMQWLMEELKHHEGLYFIDSFTTIRSVAHQVASKNELPSMKRDVFLDAEIDPRSIRQQFNLLIRRAKQNGTAIAIGHPYPETLDFLEEHLGTLADHGIELLSVSDLIRRRQALDDPRGRSVLLAEHWGPQKDFRHRRAAVTQEPGSASHHAVQ